jgi:hypothetical protein
MHKESLNGGQKNDKPYEAADRVADCIVRCLSRGCRLKGESHGRKNWSGNDEG